MHLRSIPSGVLRYGRFNSVRQVIAEDPWALSDECAVEFFSPMEAPCAYKLIRLRLYRYSLHTSQQSTIILPHYIHTYVWVCIFY